MFLHRSTLLNGNFRAPLVGYGFTFRRSLGFTLLFWNYPTSFLVFHFTFPFIWSPTVINFHHLHHLWDKTYKLASFSLQYIYESSNSTTSWHLRCRGKYLPGLALPWNATNNSVVNNKNCFIFHGMVIWDVYLNCKKNEMSQSSILDVTWDLLCCSVSKCYQRAQAQGNHHHNEIYFRHFDSLINCSNEQKWKTLIFQVSFTLSQKDEDFSCAIVSFIFLFSNTVQTTAKLPSIKFCYITGGKQITAHVYQTCPTTKHGKSFAECFYIICTITINEWQDVIWWLWY